MARFADQPLSTFLDALSSPDPTPGGGTAAAVASAMGASLLMMVAGLPKSRATTDADRQTLADARNGLARLRDRLTALADEDTEAYNRVVAAYRQPKDTDDQKVARKGAIQDAMRAATEAPLDTLRAACEAVQFGKLVARFGNPSASSDVRVGLELLEAGGAGAAANVEVNLTGLEKSDFHRSAASTTLDLTNRLSEQLAAARSALKDAAHTS